jgi:hypothetical protein
MSGTGADHGKILTVDTKDRTEKYLAQTGRTELTPKQRRRAAKKDYRLAASGGKKKKK